VTLDEGSEKDDLVRYIYIEYIYVISMDEIKIILT
jgi:hypothetical protein